MDVLLPEAREIYREAGAEVDGPARARRPRAGAGRGRQGPERFRMHARNPARNLEVGGD